MKKLLFVFLCCIPWGCTEKGLVEPNPPVVPVKYTVEIVGINATVVPSGKFTVEKGVAVNFSATAINGLESITINESKSSLTGTSYNSSLPASSNLRIEVIGKLVIVLTRTDTLCSPIKLFIKSCDVLENNVWKTFFELTENEKKESFLFHSNGNFEAFYSNGVSRGFTPWKWVGTDGFMLGDQLYTYEMTGTTLALYQEKEGKKYRNLYWRP